MWATVVGPALLKPIVCCSVILRTRNDCVVGEMSCYSDSEVVDSEMGQGEGIKGERMGDGEMMNSMKSMKCHGDEPN